MPAGLQSSVLLSELPAPPGQRRAALVVSLLVLGVFLAAAPFARVAWANLPTFVPIQKTLMLVSDLITATLLFGQYSIGRNPTLNILAAGYLFTALITIPHALTFPGVFSEHGLLSSGPQSAAWLYVAWHAVLPLAVIVFALRRPHEMALDDPVGKSGPAIFTAVLSAAGAVTALTLLVTAGHSWLPPMMEGGHFTTVTRIVVGAMLLLPLSALLVLATRRPCSVLDLWLMVVMFALLCTITIGAFLSGERFDVGWYLGSVFDWLTSIFVLLMLLSETVALYARQFHAAAIERRDRERRINEMEAILVHLSRIGELGQHVSALAHEVNQPLTAILNYAAAGMQVAETAPGQLKRLLQRLNEQAVRATEIIRNLRDFVAQHESEKRLENLHEVLQRAVRLALAASTECTPMIEMQCSLATSLAFIDRVQIEQVVFNLVRNAIEAMADSPQPVLTLATSLSSEGVIEVTVADTGPGLAPDVREKLFEPFVTTKPGGLGIGLSICRVIIEAHGGRLTADANPKGGTIFRFMIPAGTA